jgi:hypothetical protein
MKLLPKVQQYKTIKSIIEMIFLSFTRIYSRIKIFMAHNPTAETALTRISAWSKINSQQT